MGAQYDLQVQANGKKEAVPNNEAGPNRAYRRVDITVVSQLCEHSPAGNIAGLYRLLKDEG